MLGYKPRDVFNMDETGLFYAYMPFLPMISALTFHTVFYLIRDYWTRNNLESRVTRSGWLTHSQQMQMAPKSYVPLSLAKPNLPMHSTRRLGHSLAFTIATMPKHGWWWTYIKSFFVNGNMILRTVVTRFYFSRTTSPDTLFPTISDISMSKTLLPTSQHMSSH